MADSSQQQFSPFSGDPTHKVKQYERKRRFYTETRKENPHAAMLHQNDLGVFYFFFQRKQNLSFSVSPLQKVTILFAILYYICVHTSGYQRQDYYVIGFHLAHNYSSYT